MLHSTRNKKIAKYHSQRSSSPQIQHVPPRTCTSYIFQRKQRSVALQTPVKTRTKDDKRVINRTHRHERPRTVVSIAARKNWPPECICKNRSILPGMALQGRMPPTDILESYQNPSTESPVRNMGQIRMSYSV